jgi:thiamine biosynthesis lipoprotein
MAATLEQQSTTAAWQWRATGTTWRILHTGGVDSDVARAVAASVARDERRWSRFLPGSDVARLNTAAGRPVDVSRETLELLQACEMWSSRTAGVFQPLVGGTLAAWGYRRGLQDAPAHTDRSAHPQPVRSRLHVDAQAGTARIPARTRIDLGGIAKSWIAVRAAAVVTARSADPSVIVDGGGDLVAARGSHLVGVEVPDRHAPADIAGTGARIRLEEGQGVATSGYGRRRWRNGDGREAHHIIDPDTGEPGPWAHATVVSDDPVAADVLAKVLALRPDRISGMREAAMVTCGQDVRTSRRWQDVVAR